MLTDTHTHLCDPVFDADRAEVLDRATAAGIGAVILVGEDLQDARRNLKLAANYVRLKPAAGQFPVNDFLTARIGKSLLRLRPWHGFRLPGGHGD